MEDMRKGGLKKRIEDMPIEEFSAREKQVLGLNISDKIKTIPYMGNDEIIEYKTKELIGLCPATGYPDFYMLLIRYLPDRFIPELKSFRLYLLEYYKLPITHEHLAYKIFQDFKKVVRPKKVFLRLKAAGRGGIITTVEKGEKL